jgi:hypothetical protein
MFCTCKTARRDRRTRDPIFFEQAEWLRTDLESSNDVGQNAFGDMSGTEDVSHALKVFCDEPTCLNFEHVHTTLLSNSFYARAKESAARELEDQKRRNASKKRRTVCN